MLLVVLTATAEGLLDWVFKSRALAAAPSGEELLRFFALFYTATALIGVLLQTTAIRGAVARLGFARSAALLPAGVSLGALGGLLLPGLPPLIAARGTEIVLRNSIFRSAYELLFTPVPPAEKRATKLLVDVGATRLGDMAGAALIQVLLLVAGAWAGGLALVATMFVQITRLTTVANQTFPEAKSVADIILNIPQPLTQYPQHLTGTRTYFEDLTVGDVIVHANGRTMTQEHIPWTYRVMNTHPLHYDRLYSTGRSGPMSGEPIIYGGLVFAWLAGLASRDGSENAIWGLGYTEGYHTQPAYAGETVYAITRILAKEEGPAGTNAGISPASPGISCRLTGISTNTGPGSPLVASRYAS